MTPVVAVDGFAGAGGWSVACRRLGIREYGTEIMPAAIRTRSANGFRTVTRDVWSGLFRPELLPPYTMRIDSPPCQTFSMAGNGEGRDALSDVLTAIDDDRYRDAARLFELTTLLDPRTALVLTPLAHVWRDRPTYVALEQVPEVLPVWHAIAAVLRTIGYSVWSGILRAEQYGAPQTRRRAILMARLDSPVDPPVPTHSRYYSTDPGRLDPGVEKWVSMAEALEWGKSVDAPAPTLTTHADLWKWKDAPATTVAGKGEVSAREHHHHGEQSGTALKLTRDEAATLQSFPPGFAWRGSKTAQFLQIGNAVPPLMAEAVLGALIAPARERSPWESVFAEVAG